MISGEKIKAIVGRQFLGRGENVLELLHRSKQPVIAVSWFQPHVEDISENIGMETHGNSAFFDFLVSLYAIYIYNADMFLLFIAT